MAYYREAAGEQPAGMYADGPEGPLYQGAAEANQVPGYVDPFKGMNFQQRAAASDPSIIGSNSWGYGGGGDIFGSDPAIFGMLAHAAKQAGLPDDYDWMPAATAAARATNGGKGFSPGTNVASTFNAILNYSGSPALKQQVLQPNTAAWNEGDARAKARDGKIGADWDAVAKDQSDSYKQMVSMAAAAMAGGYGLQTLGAAGAAGGAPAWGEISAAGIGGGGAGLGGAATAGGALGATAGLDTVGAAGGMSEAAADSALAGFNAAVPASQISADVAAVNAGTAAFGGAGVGAGLGGGAAGSSGAGAAGAGGAAGGASGGTAAGTAATGAAKMGLSDIAGLAKDTSGVVSAVTGLNGLFGDPLGLNKGVDQANAAATNASNASADAQKQMAQIAQDQWNYYKTNYQPLETNLIQQAQAAGSPEEFARARGAANADVTGAFNTAKTNTRNTLQSYGINPASPAFQDSVASSDLAEAGARAGALTTADNNTRNLAYSKALDVTGIGRNIPAQSAASTANAANAANSAANVANSRSVTANNQSVQNTQALGYGLNSLGNAASKWFGSPTGPTAAQTYGATNYNDPALSGSNPVMFGAGYADGGPVKPGLEKRYHTPHMKVFADGGGVGRQGLEPIDNTGQVAGPGTETSDSIPAQIDGQQPAALSTNEFVMNAEVPKLSGSEILTAINEAGLAKRQGAGLEPRTSNDVPLNAGAQAYADGGAIAQYDTKLSPEEEQRFMAQFPNPGSTHDYDLRGAWKAGLLNGAKQGQHLPDTYKKPNHPTFSDESIYSGVGGNVGGQWKKNQDGSWQFTASPTNLKNMNQQQLQQYFKEVEPGNKLIVPQTGMTPMPYQMQPGEKLGAPAGLEPMPNQRRDESPMSGMQLMARGGRVQYGLGA